MDFIQNVLESSAFSCLHLLKVYFNVVFPAMFRSQNQSLSCSYGDKYSANISHFLKRASNSVRLISFMLSRWQYLLISEICENFCFAIVCTLLLFLHFSSKHSAQHVHKSLLCNASIEKCIYGVMRDNIFEVLGSVFLCGRSIFSIKCCRKKSTTKVTSCE